MCLFLGIYICKHYNWNVPDHARNGCFVQVVFEGTTGASNSEVSLDDITILPFPCPNPGSCDFEYDMCLYTNLQTDQFDWKLGNGLIMRSSGPSTDHTTGSPQGLLKYFVSMLLL